MSTPIYDRLKDIYDSEIVSFHMPGHKYGKIYEELGYSDKIEQFYKLDTTEIIGTDNLHDPKGVILESEKNAKRILLSEKNCEEIDLHYIVNGSTCGIIASILSCCRPNDKLIINRGCHQSAYNACVIGDIHPIFVNERIDYKNSIFMGSYEDEYIAKIEENRDAKAVFLTRPTYYGMCMDIEKIIEKAHEHNMLVIVDEAHGAHFGLSDKFPKSSVELRADLVIQSIHKTLPSFTQTSILLAKKESVDRNRLKRLLSMLETSSPSYLMMMSLEISFDIYEKYGTFLMERLLNSIYVFRRNAKAYDISIMDDPTKIFINTIDKGFNGYDFAKILRYNYNIQVEMSNYSGVLMLCSIANVKSDFDKMAAALKDVLEKKLFSRKIDFFDDFDNTNMGERDIISSHHSKKIKLKYPTSIPVKCVEPNEAFNSDKEMIDLKDSLNRVCGEFVIPYPPGICIIAPGEIINQEVIDFVKNAKMFDVDINGMQSRNFEKINVLKYK
ncbi:aminotransferase class I/II-fold pyridoxal phosphate-dependent enzyme [Peptostreptococcus faecalis]|uniref:aminotransferase class I/II-fold pyridoxal phosphate-dependent enzyme n=1 Tax=Peptostreptococcus faecalis TaxID=2045015 RepID=UPI000C7A567D|nr:aminotransferase class I/II-fold pyridoxal phosphate-dependent enzyme [Peptostreptococcus faecalis]